MRILKILVLVVIVFAGYKWYASSKAKNAVVDDSSPYGFISVAMPDQSRVNNVFILAPINCPSEGAQRADALSRDLRQIGIPNTRSSNFSINIQNPTAEQNEMMQRALKVFKTNPAPSVFINGMAKANPSLEEVVAEYNRTK